MEKFLLVSIAAFIVAVTRGQETCLPEPMVELNINARFLSRDSNICENDGFHRSLHRQILRNYRAPAADIACAIQNLTQVSCDSSRTRGPGQFRVSIDMRTNLTCGENGCTKMEGNKQAFLTMAEKENVLRIAMRDKRRLRFRTGDTRNIRVNYFNGKRSPMIHMCRDAEVDSIRGKLALCSCPEDCQPQCIGGMRFEECGSACPRTCENPNPAFCTLQCVRGCSCPPELVEFEGRCISPENCPEGPTEAGDDEKECPAGMEFRECGSACPPTCENQNPICTRQCVRGCSCPFGMVEFEGACIHPENCPTKEPPTEAERECPAGMVFTACGSACTPTCDNPTPFCTLQCVQRCSCPFGMVQFEGGCINPENCLTKEPPTEAEMECPAGMEFTECGSACPPTCDNQNPICTFQCVQGCFCPPGMVDLDGECVQPEACPQKEEPTLIEEEQTPIESEDECSNGMVFTECGSACPPTCENQSPICTFQCVKGCFCPTGMILHEGNCIASENCPGGESPTSDEAEEHSMAKRSVKQISCGKRGRKDRKQNEDGSGDDPPCINKEEEDEEATEEVPVKEHPHKKGKKGKNEEKDDDGSGGESNEEHKHAEKDKDDGSGQKGGKRKESRRKIAKKEEEDGSGIENDEEQRGQNRRNNAKKDEEGSGGKRKEGRQHRRKPAKKEKEEDDGSADVVEEEKEHKPKDKRRPSKPKNNKRRNSTKADGNQEFSSKDSKNVSRLIDLEEAKERTEVSHTEDSSTKDSSTEDSQTEHTSKSESESSTKDETHDSSNSKTEDHEEYSNSFKESTEKSDSEDSS